MALSKSARLLARDKCYERHNQLNSRGAESNLSRTPALLPQELHPRIASAQELRAKIKALRDQGLAPVELAKRLGISRQRVAHHLKIIGGG